MPNNNKDTRWVTTRRLREKSSRSCGRQTTKCDSEDKITWLRPIAETIMVMTVENCIVMVLLWSDRIGLFVFCVFVCAVWLVVVWLLWWGLISHRLAALYYPTLGLQKSKESLRKFTKILLRKMLRNERIRIAAFRQIPSLSPTPDSDYKKESWTEWRLLCHHVIMFISIVGKSDASQVSGIREWQLKWLLR